MHFLLLGCSTPSRSSIVTMPLGKRTDCGDAKYAGLDVPFACDIVETLEVG